MAELDGHHAAALWRDAALTDPLTGIGNRRALEIGWGTALAHARSAGLPVCLVAIDLDGLKVVNDSRGHAAGDELIVSLVAALRAGLRDSDQMFRVGGDEFVLLLPGTSASAAGTLMARVREFSAPRFSWGAADTVQDGATLAGVLECADRRLYAQRSRVRAPSIGRVELPVVPASGATRIPHFLQSRTRAVELVVLGAVALTIGSIVLSIAGGNHALCASGLGTTVVDCGLSNAVYYGGFVLVSAGGVILGAALLGAALLRGRPASGGAEGHRRVGAAIPSGRGVPSGRGGSSGGRPPSDGPGRPWG